MNKLFVIILLFFSLSAFPQSRQVRVTTKKGSVFEGTLKEFKAFEHLIVEVNGKNLLIPYETMAYIDDIAPASKSSSKSAKPKRVKTPKPPKAPKAPKPAKTPKAPQPAKTPKPAVAEPVAVAELVEATPSSSQMRSPAVAELVEAPPVAASPAVPEPVEGPPSKLVEGSPSSNLLPPFRGFLLSPGNNVYLHCTSTPSDPSYDSAALDVLKRQLRRYNFWTIVDTPSEAHFTINYTLQLQGSAKVTLSISSSRTENQETLGTAKRPEDPDDYRKIVYDLFQKYILPLQSKISANTPPKRLKSLFTLE